MTAEWARTEPRRWPMLIDGETVEAATGEWLATEDPYTLQPSAYVPAGGASEADRAVAAARKAFTSGPWSEMSAYERSKLLWRLGDEIQQAASHLGTLETRDAGKPIRENVTQAGFAGRVYHYYAGMCDKVRGRLVPMDNTEWLGYTLYEPVGVCVLITAWNSPMQLLANKLPAALAAGNTVVVKPSELNPTSTLALGDIIERVGFPRGVINLVSGGPELGEALVAHPDVDMISLTGGAATGRAVGRVSGERIRRTVMELGGKSPHIVFEDCDLDRAVDSVSAGIFSASGQSCVAGSRLLVQDTVYDQFLDAVVRRAGSIALGDPLDPGTQMGPQANRRQYETVLGFLEEVHTSDTRVATGGFQATRDLGGLFTAPTVLCDPAPHLRVCKEEVFGPVLSVFRFSTEDQALALANDSDLGLAAGVHTNDLARARRMVEGLEVGTVWVNMYRRSAATAPFGGEKRSGLGRERGWEGFLEYVRVKTVMVDSS